MWGVGSWEEYMEGSDAGWADTLVTDDGEEGVCGEARMGED